MTTLDHINGQSIRDIPKTQKLPILNPTQMVDKLKQYAEKSPVFNAVATAFAMRERTRRQITVHSIKQAMDNEGFTFSRKEYEDMLLFLASLRIGVLERNTKGRVIALKSINITLQSLGMASISKKTQLSRANLKHAQTALPTSPPGGKRLCPKDTYKRGNPAA